MDHENGWNEYEKLILNELARLSVSIESLRVEIADFKVNQAVTVGKLYAEISSLKVKSSLFGALAGVITALSMLLVYYFRNLR